MKKVCLVFGRINVLGDGPVGIAAAGKEWKSLKTNIFVRSIQTEKMFYMTNSANMQLKSVID